jgi:uncharacterized glyoxalase superfamily protein PhnB
MPSFKSADYNTVSPYLIVTDAAATIRFLAEALDAKLLRHFPDEQGRHDACRSPTRRFGDHARRLCPEWPPVAAYARGDVADVDVTCKRALAAGKRSVRLPDRRAMRTSGEASGSPGVPRGGWQAESAEPGPSPD